MSLEKVKRALELCYGTFEILPGFEAQMRSAREALAELNTYMEAPKDMAKDRYHYGYLAAQKDMAKELTDQNTKLVEALNKWQSINIKNGGHSCQSLFVTVKGLQGQTEAILKEFDN